MPVPWCGRIRNARIMWKMVFQMDGTDAINGRHGRHHDVVNAVVERMQRS